MIGNNKYQSGRGAQFNSSNKFLKDQYVVDHIEGVDEEWNQNHSTKIQYESPKKIINSVKSPDLKFDFSMNPYQGCEHGCIYCYARNTHEYWGLSAGLDFESTIIAKPSAPSLLEKELNHPNWYPTPIMLSGNTDCYQPIEKQLEITRKLLIVLEKYQNPVGIITKNALILRDLDILSSLASNNLVSIIISVTTTEEVLRRKLEPRTASIEKRIQTIETLSKNNIPVGVMIAPVIPGLNNNQIPEILKRTAEAGAVQANMTMIRLNGSVKWLFKDWLEKNIPDRFDKVWNQIESIHDGKVNDSKWGRRMTGSGPMAESIRSLFDINRRKYFGNKSFPPLDHSKFRRNGNYNLFV